MNDNKQRLLVEYLISSPDTYTKTRMLLKPSYFEPDLRNAIAWINSYFDSYHTIPSINQIEVETGVTFALHDITVDQIEYCSTEIEQFCRRKAVEQAIIDAPALIKQGKYTEVEESVREALLISMSSDVGLDYFNTPLDRLEDELLEAPRISVGFGPQFDEFIGGGLERTEMMLFTANSGGGKSIIMTNVGLHFATEHKLNVLYISLELSQKLIGHRMDHMISGISTVLWRTNYETIAYEVIKQSKNAGNFTIKRMQSGTTALQIRGVIKDYQLKYKHVPDMLIVDYLDIMGSNELVSADNVSEKDKRVAEQLRDIGETYNMYMVSASQQNRTAIDAPRMTQAHIAGGLTKIHAVDIAASILWSEKMKAAGEIGFAFTKVRNGEGTGKIAMCDWDNKYLRAKPPSRHIEPPSQEAPATNKRNTYPNPTPISVADILGQIHNNKEEEKS